MIPLVGVVSVRHWRHSRNFRALDTPVPVVVACCCRSRCSRYRSFLVVCLISRVNPLEAIATFWYIFSALKDTHIEVDNRNALVLVQIL